MASRINYIMRISLILMNIVYFVLIQIYSFIYRKKSAKIPPVNDSLLMIDAATLAEKIRKREITCYKLAQAYIERIKQVNPILNAAVDDRFDAALSEAQACDNQLRSNKINLNILKKEKPLYGLPFTVKECCPVKGLSYTAGSLSLKGQKASADAKIVQILRNAGAIPLCVTNMPEMCGGFDSNNLLYGRTCNPYDTRYVSGGSTGGEGSLLGAGASLFGIGSDLAGSIRIPALFCGIFGFKPTIGIIPTNDHLPWDDDYIRNLLTFGPMARYAGDLHLFMKVATSNSDFKERLRLDEPVNLKKIRVYYRQSLDSSLGMLEVLPEIKECVLKAANHFKENGTQTEKLPIDWPVNIVEMVILLLKDVNSESISELLVDHKRRKNPIVEMLKALSKQSTHTKSLLFFLSLVYKRYPFTENDIVYYTNMRDKIRQELQNLLGDDGIFFYPLFRIPATFGEVVLGEIINSMPYSALANILGFPAVQVPMGLNKEGLPIGFQVIAAPYQDRLCLAVAKELESAFGGWVPPSISVTNNVS